MPAAQAPPHIKATDCSALRAPASLRSASVGAKRVPLARSALPVFAFRTIALHAHTG